jgi:hypothetical protein
LAFLNLVGLLHDKFGRVVYIRLYHIVEQIRIILLLGDTFDLRLNFGL